MSIFSCLFPRMRRIQPYSDIPGKDRNRPVASQIAHVKNTDHPLAMPQSSGPQDDRRPSILSRFIQFLRQVFCLSSVCNTKPANTEVIGHDDLGGVVQISDAKAGTVSNATLPESGPAECAQPAIPSIRDEVLSMVLRPGIRAAGRAVTARAHGVHPMLVLMKDAMRAGEFYDLSIEEAKSIIELFCSSDPLNADRAGDSDEIRINKFLRRIFFRDNTEFPKPRARHETPLAVCGKSIKLMINIIDVAKTSQPNPIESIANIYEEKLADLEYKYRTQISADLHNGPNLSLWSTRVRGNVNGVDFVIDATRDIMLEVFETMNKFIEAIIQIQGSPTDIAG